MNLPCDLYSFPHMNATDWYTVWFASLDRIHICKKYNIDNIISIVSIVRNHVTTCRDPFAADFSLGLGPSVWNPFKIAQMVLPDGVAWCWSIGTSRKTFWSAKTVRLTDESKIDSMDDHTCPTWKGGSCTSFVQNFTLAVISYDL